ncbi:hypothetical protein J6A31_04955 [bacterium]|nr:hypothetical protein [bacterium]
MVNFETLKLIETLNEFASKSNNGFLPFSKVKSYETMNEYVVYDDSQYDEQNDGDKSYRIIKRACPLNGQRDITSYYDNSFVDGDVVFRLIESVTDTGVVERYIEATVLNQDETIIVKQGKWSIH